MRKAVLERSEQAAGSTALFHVIDPQVFKRQLLDELCDLATRVRTIAKHPAGARFLQDMLPHRRAMPVSYTHLPLPTKA